MVDPKMMVAYSTDPEEDCTPAGSSGCPRILDLSGKSVLTYVTSSAFDVGFFKMAYTVFISLSKE